MQGHEVQLYAITGWHGPRRGAQEQHHPRVPRVCCPANRTHPPKPCGCTLPLNPACRRLDDNGLGDDAKQALRAAARSGLKLILNDDDF